MKRHSLRERRISVGNSRRLGQLEPIERQIQQARREYITPSGKGLTMKGAKIVGGVILVLGGYVLIRALLARGSEDSGETEATGTGPCSNIEDQLDPPKGCKNPTVIGYVAGVERPMTIREVSGNPGRYVQFNPVDVYSPLTSMIEAARSAGVTIKLNSAFRTMAKQRALYRDYLIGFGNKAARPGRSNHQAGLAIDVNYRDAGVVSWLRQNASRFGFRETVSGEPWHWEYRP
jgi:hypothetical protein